MTESCLGVGGIADGTQVPGPVREFARERVFGLTTLELG
jgi:hypothetical protein